MKGTFANVWFAETLLNSMPKPPFTRPGAGPSGEFVGENAGVLIAHNSRYLAYPEPSVPKKLLNKLAPDLAQHLLKAKAFRLKPPLQSSWVHAQLSSCAGNGDLPSYETGSKTALQSGFEVIDPGCPEQMDALFEFGMSRRVSRSQGLVKQSLRKTDRGLLRVKGNSGAERPMVGAEVGRLLPGEKNLKLKVCLLLYELRDHVECRQGCCIADHVDAGNVRLVHSITEEGVVLFFEQVSDTPMRISVLIGREVCQRRTNCRGSEHQFADRAELVDPNLSPELKTEMRAGGLRCCRVEQCSRGPVRDGALRVFECVIA